ncbi:MAG TPA: hypothetical protein VEQ59_01090, partial [Polyangiaceae bacterium]|nr:hypothetical protein [Polyangiaceae bacterium]
MNSPAAGAPAYVVWWNRLRSDRGLLWVLPLIVFVVERFFWPKVASWREDEATVMWIGHRYGVLDFTTGIISSTGVPNPPGLLWVAKLVSFAPDLYWSGVFLQLLHLALLFGLCWALTRRVSAGAGLALFLSIGCLLAYRSSGSEPFSQWLMLPTTLACVYFFMGCVTQPSFARLFVLLGLLWIPPALYIAGVLNSAIFALAIGACLGRADFRRRLLASDWKRPLGIFALWSAAQLLLIWKPYFSVVALHDLRSVSKTAPGERLGLAVLELLRLPIWLWEYTINAEFRPSYYNDARIVSSSWFLLLGHAAQWLFRLLVVAVVAIGVRARIWKQAERWRWIYWPLALLLLALVLSPLLGGPCFTRGERQDIGFQWTCLVFLPIAVVLAAPGVVAPLRVAGYGLLLSFVAAQMVAGFITYRAHNRYQGDVLTEVDVPVRQKMAVIDAIVAEAKQRHLDG